MTRPIRLMPCPDSKRCSTDRLRARLHPQSDTRHPDGNLERYLRLAESASSVAGWLPEVFISRKRWERLGSIPHRATEISENVARCQRQRGFSAMQEPAQDSRPADD